MWIGIGCLLSLWLMAAAWINVVVGMGFRPVCGSDVVGHGPWCLSCGFG